MPRRIQLLFRWSLVIAYLNCDSFFYCPSLVLVEATYKTRDFPELSGLKTKISTLLALLRKLSKISFEAGTNVRMVTYRHPRLKWLSLLFHYLAFRTVTYRL
jgi:hypothetical protein